MATATSPRGALVIDANIAVALAAHESGRDAAATAEIAKYSAHGYALYAPGAIVTETLYALCHKLNDGTLTITSHAAAIKNFEHIMQSIEPPPIGEAALIVRAEQMRAAFGCSRSADGVYIALAESLGSKIPTILLTFDKGLLNQAAQNAPTVSVQLL